MAEPRNRRRSGNNGIASGITFLAAVRDTFKKYRGDNAQLIVSAVSFYLVLTFVPFVLLSLSVAGYIIDLTDLDEHLLTYLSTAVPEPYNVRLVSALTRDFSLIEVTKNVSGPLGLLALLFFTSRLFAVLIPGFHLMFGERPDGFLRGKQKELAFTFLFALLQGLIFFATLFIFIVQSRVVTVFSDHTFVRGSLQFFSFVDALMVFLMFALLYYLLTPARRDRRALFGISALAAVLWTVGKHLFRYYVAYVGRFDTLFGAYGIFIGSMFWVYYSVFVFVACAELQAVLLQVQGTRRKVQG